MKMIPAVLIFITTVVDTTSVRSIGSRKFHKGSVWPNAQIPYKFNPQLKLTRDGFKAIHTAMKFVESISCIRYVSVAKLKCTGADCQYIYFTDGPDCTSLVGFERSISAHPVSVPTWCLKPEAILHELVHIAGFGHEQCRYDVNLS